MIYDIFLDIAELRAELASCYLTKRERAETQKRLAILIERAKEAVCTAVTNQATGAPS